MAAMVAPAAAAALRHVCMVMRNHSVSSDEGRPRTGTAEGASPGPRFRTGEDYFVR